MMKTIQYSFRYSGCVVIISALGLIALAFLVYFLLFSIGITAFTLLAVTAVAALIEPIVSMPLRLSYDGERVVLRRLLTSKTYSHADYHIEVVTGLELSGGYVSLPRADISDSRGSFGAPRWASIGSSRRSLLAPTSRSLGGARGARSTSPTARQQKYSPILYKIPCRRPSIPCSRSSMRSPL